MSAKYDMEAAEPNAGHLHTHMKSMQVNLSSAEVPTPPYAGLSSTRWVA